MKQLTRRSLLSVLTVVTFLAFFGCGSVANAGKASDNTNNSAIDTETIMNMPSDSLSQAEVDGLLYMREEEKLARDVYIVLYQSWGQRVFNNISRSEQMHTDAIKTLIYKYSLTDPVNNDSLGIFKNETLQSLFNSLTAQGKTSLVEALKAGALIEEIDILDLQRELDENVDNEDISFVYENLLRGSRNHLRAFVRNLQRQGVTYEPLKLSPDVYQAIIDSDMERGRR